MPSSKPFLFSFVHQCSQDVHANTGESNPLIRAAMTLPYCSLCCKNWMPGEYMMQITCKWEKSVRQRLTLSMTVSEISLACGLPGSVPLLSKSRWYQASKACSKSQDSQPGLNQMHLNIAILWRQIICSLRHMTERLHLTVGWEFHLKLWKRFHPSTAYIIPFSTLRFTSQILLDEK